MLRLFWIGWLFHLKSLMHSLFFVLISVLQPVIFASIAFFMVENGNRSGTLLYVALGALATRQAKNPEFSPEQRGAEWQATAERVGFNGRALIDAAAEPLGRYSTAAEQAGGVVLLGSALAGIVTGVVLPVDGGFMGSLATGQIDISKMMGRAK